MSGETRGRRKGEYMRLLEGKNKCGRSNMRGLIGGVGNNKGEGRWIE